MMQSPVLQSHNYNILKVENKVGTRAWVPIPYTLLGVNIR